MEPVRNRHRRQEGEEEENLLLEYVTGDWMRVVLTNLHPKDGLPAMFLCKGVRASLGGLDTMWEMWAYTLWPRNTVTPAIPCLYPNFEDLVRDNNRRGECMPRRRTFSGFQGVMHYHRGVIGILSAIWLYIACFNAVGHGLDHGC